MTPENFCYWLRGLIEVGKPKLLTKDQIDIISKHLDLVLTPIIKHNDINDIDENDFEEDDEGQTEEHSSIKAMTATAVRESYSDNTLNKRFC